MRVLAGRLVVLAAAAALSGIVLAQPKSDWEIKLEEREWQEGEVKLPDFPKAENLIEFEANLTSSFRFYVDSQSIDVGGGVVRYTLVGRSGSGTDNVSFNGLRCKTGEHKLYANGRTTDKAWVRVRESPWKVIEAKAYTRQHLVLLRDFFCPGAVPIMTRAEGVDALKKGFHPYAISNHPPTR